MVRLPVVMLFELTEVKVPCTCRFPVTMAGPLPWLLMYRLVAAMPPAELMLPAVVRVPVVVTGPVIKTFPTTLKPVKEPT